MHPTQAAERFTSGDTSVALSIVFQVMAWPRRINYLVSGVQDSTGAGNE